MCWVSTVSNAVLQSYFRNNVLHLFACAILGGLLLPEQPRMSRAGVVRLGRWCIRSSSRSCSCRGCEDEFGARIAGHHRF
jgi:glycerol-3-phosphate O-acyltransferase